MPLLWLVSGMRQKLDVFEALIRNHIQDTVPRTLQGLRELSSQGKGVTADCWLLTAPAVARCPLAAADCPCCCPLTAGCC